MDILTLELFDVTVSEALREINRVLEAHSPMPLRILLGNDPMLRHNVQRFLERLGRPAHLDQDGSNWRFEVAGIPVPRPAPVPALPAPAPPPSLPIHPPPSKPLLLTRAHLGQGSQDIGRRLLLGVLRQLDSTVPWLGLALDALELLDDPQARSVLELLQARGIPVRISRESQLFPLEPAAFEVMEDSQWQRLAGRGEITIL
ncbi:MAG: hypothetical protein P4L36_15015 [Holophaga sp.]|nr:hypothetical protein [Holophaga sp.]